VKTVIHVNQHVIKANRKHGTNRPCLTVKDYKRNRYGHVAVIRDGNGNEVARVVYSKDKPLACGAHCWVETQLDVEVTTIGMVGSGNEALDTIVRDLLKDLATNTITEADAFARIGEAMVTQVQTDQSTGEQSPQQRSQDHG